MVSEELLFKVKNLPTSPGVYLMKDATGTVIYIGKARVLKNRVSSYFQEGRVRDAGTAAKVARLQEQVVDLDFFATDNEVEALLLEDDLVKRYRPKYNVQLKDDKSFPFVMVTTGERFPRVEVIRGPHLYPQESRFFGPYVDKKAVVRALKTLRKVFPFCTCKEPCDRSRNARPCIYYQLKQCPAPCSGKVSEAAYRENISGMFVQAGAGDQSGSLSIMAVAVIEGLALQWMIDHDAIDRQEVWDTVGRFRDAVKVSLPEGLENNHSVT